MNDTESQNTIDTTIQYNPPVEETSSNSVLPIVGAVAFLVVVAVIATLVMNRKIAKTRAVKQSDKPSPPSLPMAQPPTNFN